MRRFSAHRVSLAQLRGNIVRKAATHFIVHALLTLCGEEEPNPSPVHAPRVQAELDKHANIYEFRRYWNAGHADCADSRRRSHTAAQDIWHRVLVFYKHDFPASRLSTAGSPGCLPRWPGLLFSRAYTRASSV